MISGDETICSGTHPDCWRTRPAGAAWAWLRLPCGQAFCPACSAPVAIAVDVDGELAMLETALLTVERAAVMATWLAQRRAEIEDATRRDRLDLGHSSRRRKLSYAADELRHGVELLGKAMLASGTIDDEIPF